MFVRLYLKKKNNKTHTVWVFKCRRLGSPNMALLQVGGRHGSAQRVFLDPWLQRSQREVESALQPTCRCAS